MKGVLIFVLFFFIAAEIRAQVAVTSLQITLSDIQSVKIIELPAQSKAVFSNKKPGKSKVQILNPSASQIRKIESDDENADLNSEQKNKGSQSEYPASRGNNSVIGMQIASFSLNSKKAVPLVVYQVDPR